MASVSPIMTDKDVAKFFGISVRTLMRRFWLRENMERLAGITRGN